MKYLIASDLHGSYYYAEQLKKAYNREKPDKLVLLGDLYYHGPRNPLTRDYNPMKCCELLNSLKNVLIVIKGNCDAEIDETISDFDFHDHYILALARHRLYLTHGHKITDDDITSLKADDILCHGHTHVCGITKCGEGVILNPGSLSLPKENTPHSYAVIDDDSIILKTVNGEQIDRLEL